jgi:hypothetical protein
MKKRYLILFVAVIWLLLTHAVEAQPFTGGVFSTIPAGGPLSNAATWVGGVQPPDNCVNCQILIFGNSTVDQPGIILTNDCQIIIEANATLTVDARVEIMNHSMVLIGSDSSSTASMVFNAEGDLDTTSTVRLASIHAYIDASSDMTSPSDSLDAISGDGGGLYYITGPTTYSELIDEFGYGIQSPPAPPGHFFGQYNINCGTVGSGNPNICNGGFVYGPALSGWNPADSIYEFNVDMVLPVELTSFTAILNGNQMVDVDWSTAQEVNSSYYLVERSAEAKNFVEIGRVKAKGFSSITTNYAYTDQTPLPATGYYRLKMVDLDGKFKYSQVVTVFRTGEGPSLLILSNPFLDQVRLEVNSSIPDQLLLTLTDLQGRVILRKQQSIQPGGNLVNLDPGSTLSQGMYLLQVKGNTINQTIQLIKQP